MKPCTLLITSIGTFKDTRPLPFKCAFPSIWFIDSPVTEELLVEQIWNRKPKHGRDADLVLISIGGRMWNTLGTLALVPHGDLLPASRAE